MGDTSACKFFPEEGYVKGAIVGREDRSVKQREEIGDDFGEPGCAGNHGAGDSVDRCHPDGVFAGVDKGFLGADQATVGGDLRNADFDDPSAFGCRADGFKVQDGVNGVPFRCCFGPVYRVVHRVLSVLLLLQ